MLMTDLFFLRSSITMPWPMGELDSSQVRAEILLLACSSEMSHVFEIGDINLYQFFDNMTKMSLDFIDIH